MKIKITISDVSGSQSVQIHSSATPVTDAFEAWWETEGDMIRPRALTIKEMAQLGFFAGYSAKK